MSSERRLAAGQQAVVDWLKDVADQGGVGVHPGGAEQFRRDLMQRLDALPVRVPSQTADAVTLLYSGPLGDQVRGGWEIAESIGRQSSGRVVTIGETPLGALQNDPLFSRALQEAVGSDHAHLYTELMDGIRPDGTRVESVWDRASRRLALAAEGDVRTLTPSALDGKVFASVELPALLDNPKVSHVNGVPVEAYRRIYETTPGTVPDKLSRVNEAVQASSHDLTREMRWREVPESPKGAGHFEVDTGRLFEGTPYRSPIRMPAEAADFDMRQGDPSLTPEQRHRMASGRQHLGEVLEQVAPPGHLHDGPRIRAGTVLKGLGVAGTAYGLYEGYGEFRDAVDGARSTREQYVRGAEAATDMAVRGGVSGTAAVVGGAVGGAGGTLIAPGAGTAGGAIVVGGAAAYGAERAYEDSRVQQWSRALGRGIGEIGYDHFSREGRLLRRLEGLQASLAEAGTSAERERIQRELDTVGTAFKAEADRNNAYFEGRGQIEQSWEELSGRFPTLGKGDVVDAYERRFEVGSTPTLAVRGAYSDAVHDEVQPRALPYVPEIDYAGMDEKGLRQAWQQHTGAAAQGQRQIEALERRGPEASGVPLVGDWLAQRRHDTALEDLRNAQWRDSGHVSAIEEAMRAQGIEPSAARLPVDGYPGRAAPRGDAWERTGASPAPLSPVSRQLLDDSMQAVAGVAARHGLPWDAGMANTAGAVAASAREAGLARVNLLRAEGGWIRAGEYDGMTVREIGLDASHAANTPPEQWLQRLVALDLEQARVPQDGLAAGTPVRQLAEPARSLA